MSKPQLKFERIVTSSILSKRNRYLFSNAPARPQVWHLVGLSHRFGRTLQSDNSLPEGRLEGRCQGRCDGRCQGRLKSSETPCTSAFYRPTGGLDETFQNDRFWHARSMTWHHKIIDLAVTRQIFALFLGGYSFFSYLCRRINIIC